MAATMIIDAPVAPTGLYPRLYPTLDVPPAQFLPVNHQENQEKAAAREEVLQRSKEEDGEEENGGSCSENGTKNDSAKEEAGSDHQDPQVSHSSSSDATESACKSPTESSESRETTADAANGQETMKEGQQTQREELVDQVWEEFMTHFLLGSRHIQKAAIFDLETKRPLAMNGKLQMSEEEMDQLVLSLQHHQLAYRNGLTVEGRTYKVRLADGRNGIWARTGQEGCTVCKTHSLVIIGVHDQSGNSRKCNEDVMRLGDFFRKKAL